VNAESTLACAEDPQQKVVVRLAKPELNGDYECAYEIVGLGIDITRFAAGLDSMQALQLAFAMVGAELAHIEQTTGFHLRFGDGDTGFPRPWTFGDSRHARDQIRNRKPLGPLRHKLRGPSVLLFLAGCAWAQTHSRALPRFKNYPANEIFTATPAAPRLVTPLEQTYADRIRDGVEKGYGVFRDGKEKKGPNFAGHMIVVQWGCGSTCMRMAIVDARTGDVYYPPISFDGTAASSFDLPLLIVGESVPQNPKVQFRLNSSLMIIQATPSPSEHPPCCAYYFFWRRNRWILLRRDQLR